MALAYYEMTIRISDARKLLGKNHLKKVNAYLNQLDLPKPPLIWCLYQDYLVWELQQTELLDLAGLKKPIVAFEDVENFVKKVTNLLYDCEITIWYLVANNDKRVYLTFFSDRNSAKTTETVSTIGYVFGEYK